MNSVIITDYGVALGKTGDQLVVRDPRLRLGLSDGGSSSASTFLVVIGGAPFAAASTGRPNLPRLSVAPRGEPLCRTSLLPSSLSSTLSPAFRSNAFRIRAGITICPLVESVELLIAAILTRLTFGAKLADARLLSCNYDDCPMVNR